MGDRASAIARRVGRWFVGLSPRTILIAGWVVFLVGSYPGYASFDTGMQLAEVRAHAFTTSHPPLMSLLWAVIEYVAAGPAPMLVLQGGLLLFGMARVLRTVQSPRAAAVTAASLLAFPPVFAPMAVIWPHSLMAGLLMMGTGLAIDPRRGARIAAVAMFVVAAACRPEIVPALVPLALLVVPKAAWWKRAAIAIAVVIGIGAVARVSDRLVSKDSHAWEQQFVLLDVVGTLRRAKLADADVTRALDGVALADAAAVPARIKAAHDAIDAWPLSNGAERIIDPVKSGVQARALRAAWRRVVIEHPGAYLVHRWTMTRGLLGISGAWAPVYQAFGDHALMGSLHHRARPSDWQRGVRWVMSAVGKTPLFRPWLYLLLVLPALFLARRWQVIRALAASGLVYELMAMVFAPAPEYRYSHWLITTTSLAYATILVGRSRRFAAGGGSQDTEPLGERRAREADGERREDTVDEVDDRESQDGSIPLV